MARVTTKQAQAARKSWQERAETWREKINTSRIIKRLDDFVAGAKAPEGCVVFPEDPTQKMLDAAQITKEQYQILIESAPESMPVEMTAGQIKSAQVLLDRVMPTLSASEITRKDVPVNPEQLIEEMRKRYGDEFANKLAKDYAPNEPETEQVH